MSRIAPPNPPVPASPAPGGPGGMPPVAELQGRPIGRVLTKMGKCSREQVMEALKVQQTLAAKGNRSPVGRILIDLGYVKEADLSIGLAAQKGYEAADLRGIDIPKEVIAAIPPQMATTHKVLPIKFDKAKRTITVAMSNHENFRALDDLRTLMGYTVTAKIADGELLEKLIQKHYNAAADSLGDILGELQTDESLKDLKKGAGASIDLEVLKDAADSNPVRKLINLVLLQAIKDKASDIHFEPFEEEFKMRYRIDGVLYEMMPPPSHIAPAISSAASRSWRTSTSPSGACRRTGVSSSTVNNQPIDLRVSVLPTMFGESVVMRVLDRGNVSLDLDKIGMRDEDLAMCNQLIRKPNGIVIVTGPTGSGKTTTLYSALRALNDPSTKLITAEDPVEYDIDGIVQCQVKPDIDLTFGRILRAMLRQDPDIVLIGEIRDKETAEIAVQASLTGHLVFSTLHTNDAPSSIARLLDLGLGAVPGDGHARGRDRAAAGPAHLQQLQNRIRPGRRAGDGAGHPQRRREGQKILLRQRLRSLQQHRLPRANGRVRDHDARRRHARHDRQPRQHAGAPQRGDQARPADTARVGPAGNLRRHHHDRGSGSRNDR